MIIVQAIMALSLQQVFIVRESSLITVRRNIYLKGSRVLLTFMLCPYLDPTPLVVLLHQSLGYIQYNIVNLHINVIQTLL